MTRFAAPADRALTATTWLISALLLSLGLGLPALGWLVPAAGDGPLLPLLLVPLPLAAVVLLTWALAPRGFAIEAGELVILRPLRTVRIPLASITAVERLSPHRMAGALRVAGSSGLFGHYGRFWSRTLGHYRLYARRAGGLVGVDAGAGRFVLAPEPVEGFLTALRRAAPGAAERLPEAGPAARPRPGWWLAGGVLGAVLLMLGGTLVGVHAFAPRGASVTGAAVVIERQLARDVRIDLDAIRSAERLAPGYQLGWWRVNGTSWVGGVAYGRFASRALGRFQLYAWRRGPAVLLETRDGRVVLTPEDPDAFVEAVRAGLPTANP